jgi:hypothetical protein
VCHVYQQERIRRAGQRLMNKHGLPSATMCSSNTVRLPNCMAGAKHNRTDWAATQTGRATSANILFLSCCLSGFLACFKSELNPKLVKALCYKPEGRGFETRRGDLFSIYLIAPAALGPGVYSTSNRNEYQKQRIVSG